ncbi:DUF1636 domain-containing protein (plasmid) [Azospirillum oryzae]|uniref:DUF1636 domain-containing protein n=1 Tax=Azospirillum oryzae TaxID=286727 RepID=A0A6N1AQP7_9PROT|nr:DUF1636 domain-containing protein [Azospirillum oryzae]KAA0587668.1 DUF1636 domain-containing protein [Azospirillum oryzae]QKS53779.1 DUF1636 domain-containing protein [Azospirillum oryzae]GLR82712.1 hypothetical protein GCM10007856_54130 [Azospirillum oryzae]
MTVELVVCETCRRPEDPPEAVRPGAELVALMVRALADSPDLAAQVRLRPMRCLMSCRRPCAVAVRSASRMSYVLGDFAPDEMTVETLTAYLRAYAATEDGIVPFKQWPQGVKGRFVSRLPPLEEPDGQV